MGSFAWAASLASQNESKSCGRGVESPIFVGATAAPSAYSPLLRPVLPPTKPGVAAWSDVGAVAEATTSGAAVLVESLAYASTAT